MQAIRADCCGTIARATVSNPARNSAKVCHVVDPYM